MMGQLLWRRKDVVGQRLMELSLKLRLIKSEVDLQQPKQKKQPSPLTMNSPQLQREGEAGLKAPKRRHQPKRLAEDLRAGAAGGRVKKHLLKRMQLPLRKSRMKMKRMKALTSKVFQLQLYTKS